MSSYLWIFHLPDNSMISEVQALSAEVKAKSADTTISCTITGLAAKATVTWHDDKGAPLTAADYTPEEGAESSGTQTSKLKVKATAVKEDKAYICRVKSKHAPSSPHSDTSVALDVYGEIQERVLHD